MRKLPTLVQCILLILPLSIGTIATDASAQVGDATITPNSPAQTEPYGINSIIQGTGTATFTRHYREGNEGGIGSSYLGTTSATSESKPVSRYISPTPLPSSAVSVPSAFNPPQPFSETMLYSPALAPTPYPNPSPDGLATQNYNPAGFEKINSSPYNLFWGHQQPWGAFQPSTSTFHGSELLPK